jgi:hypothetical protein
VRFGDLAFLTACGCFGNSGGLGAACSFNAFCGRGAGSLFGLAQSTSHRGVGVFCLMGARSLCCVPCRGLCSRGGGFSFGLGQQRLLANLFGGAMPQLGAILAP